MSLPASSAPIAVLVLAWDETTPAVRALVEAAETPDPALDSVVVLVPAGPATAELTQEEFLPIEAGIELPLAEPVITPLVEEQPAPEEQAIEPNAESPEAVATTDSPIIEEATPTAAPAALQPLAAVTASLLPSFADALAALPVVELPAPALAGPTSATLGWQGVRVLRLSNYSLATLATYAQQPLPAPAWTGAARVPASPYIGSSAMSTAAIASLSPVADALLHIAAPGSETMPALALPAAQPALTPWEIKAISSPATDAAPLAFLPAELPAALDAESNTVPTPAADELVPTAEASTTELSEEAADELEETFAVDVTPVQAGWADALASLQEPATLAEATQPTAATTAALISADQSEEAPSEITATATPAAPPVLALHPAAQQFDAPNLNFQIIQYARFAVPLALAEPPFDVIYAPAWPTWLAAQELRQRTGQPLVLHIATLAAAEDEPIDLAAGWVAEIQRQALHRADLILTETPALAARLRHELVLPAFRVRAVPAADADAVALALRTVRP